MVLVQYFCQSECGLGNRRGEPGFAMGLFRHEYKPQHHVGNCGVESGQELELVDDVGEPQRHVGVCSGPSGQKLGLQVATNTY